MKRNTDVNKLKREVLKKLKYWRTDIIAFVQEAFYHYESDSPIIVTDQQREVLLSIQEPGAHVAVKAGHGVSKTCTEVWVAIWGILCFFDIKIPVTAPSAPQLKDVFMAELHKWVGKLHPWLRSQVVCATMGAHIKGRQKLQFISARTSRREDPSALQGFHAPQLIFICDEAFGIPDAVFQVAEGALTGESARVLLCGNPTSLTGYAYDAFNRNSGLWKLHTLSCLDAPEWLVSPEYAKNMALKYGEDSDIYKCRVLGEFPSASFAQLIPTDLVEQAMNRHLRIEEYKYAPVILGVDVSYFGDDRSIIVKRQGLHVEELGSWYNIGHADLTEQVMFFKDKYRADAVMVDSIGVGSGVVDNLNRAMYDPTPINFGGRAMKAKYYNKRAECWGEMKEWLALGGALPRDDGLLKELTAVIYGFTGTGKLQLEAKKDVKKRIGFSPDKADAIALTFGSPVASNRRDITQLLAEITRLTNEKNLDILNERENPSNLH